MPCTGEDCLGELYLRCDEGNPGKIFESIEAIAFKVAFKVTTNSNVTVDNICMKYYLFGVSAHRFCQSLHVTNCEIGWIGGGIQSYAANGDKNQSATRYGNGIEIYVSCKNFYVDSSSSLYELSPERATEIIRAYGVDRVLFGSDFPVFSPDIELERFMALPLTDDEKRAILSENVLKLYNI